MFKTFRSTLVFIFLLFAMLPIAVLLLANLYATKEKELELITKELRKLHISQLEDYKLVADFLSYDVINPQFYIDKKSENLEYVTVRQHAMRLRLVKLIADKNVRMFNVDSIMLDILDNQVNYSALVDEMAQLQLKRGFKDFGVEGEMRDVVHILMERKDLNQVDILMCRRHEKDYIIRNDLSYVTKLLRKVDEIYATIDANTYFTSATKDSLHELLNNYTMLFEQIVQYDQLLGIKTNQGIKGKMDKAAAQIQEQFETIVIQIENKRHAILFNYRLGIGILIALIIIFSVVLSFILAKRVTHRLSLLTESINMFVESNFENHECNIPVVASEADDEIGKLLLHYTVMKSKIVELIYDFKAKVEERTFALEDKSRKIEKQNEEILNQRDELLATNNYMEEQKSLLERQNHEIMDSLRYAAGIQQAMMPDSAQITSIFPEHFIYYRPLGIVSGDFFWVYQLHVHEKKYNIFVVADCTGHGVPGALMSMLGISFLNELVIQQQILSPALILQKLKEYIVDSQKRHNSITQHNDGMDIAIGVIDIEQCILHFAGANRNLIVIRDNELSEYHANKQSVSKSQHSNIEFLEQEIQLNENDALYAFTDGFTDQFGGADNKKFTKRRFKELLLEINTETMSKQQNIISDTFNKWRGKNQQIDDVLILGLRFTKCCKHEHDLLYEVTNVANIN